MLKNALLTAAMVAAFTMLSCILAVAAMFVASGSQLNNPLLAIVMIVVMATLFGLIGGLFIAPVSLAIAALTIPPAVFIGRRLGMSRPAIDIVGGAAAGYLCAGAGIELADSIHSMVPRDPEMQVLMFRGIGLACGALLGFVRFSVIVKPAQQTLPEGQLNTAY